jgi:hypothetical protein
VRARPGRLGLALLQQGEAPDLLVQLRLFLLRLAEPVRRVLLQHRQRGRFRLAVLQRGQRFVVGLLHRGQVFLLGTLDLRLRVFLGVQVVLLLGAVRVFPICFLLVLVLVEAGLATLVLLLQQRRLMDFYPAMPIRLGELVSVKIRPGWSKLLDRVRQRAQ